MMEVTLFESELFWESEDIVEAFEKKSFDDPDFDRRVVEMIIGEEAASELIDSLEVINELNFKKIIKKGAGAVKKGIGAIKKKLKPATKSDTAKLAKDLAKNAKVKKIADGPGSKKEKLKKIAKIAAIVAKKGLLGGKVAWSGFAFLGAAAKALSKDIGGKEVNVATGKEMTDQDRLKKAEDYFKRLNPTKNPAEYNKARKLIAALKDKISGKSPGKKTIKGYQRAAGAGKKAGKKVAKAAVKAAKKAAKSVTARKKKQTAGLNPISMLDIYYSM